MWISSTVSRPASCSTRSTRAGTSVKISEPRATRHWVLACTIAASAAESMKLHTAQVNADHRPAAADMSSQLIAQPVRVAQVELAVQPQRGPPITTTDGLDLAKAGVVVWLKHRSHGDHPRSLMPPACCCVQRRGGRAASMLPAHQRPTPQHRRQPMPRASAPHRRSPRRMLDGGQWALPSGLDRCGRSGVRRNPRDQMHLRHPAIGTTAVSVPLGTGSQCVAADLPKPGNLHAGRCEERLVVLVLRIRDWYTSA